MSRFGIKYIYIGFFFLGLVNILPQFSSDVSWVYNNGIVCISVVIKHLS
jgi:hypothetical protein